MTTRPARDLDDVARRARPLVLARDRSVALGSTLGDLVPEGAVVRGSVLRVVGAAGAGATTVAFELAAAFTAVGEWTAAVDLDAPWACSRRRKPGVALDRFAVVRRVPPARWATVVAALLDGVSLVLAEVPRGVRLGDARRLEARARERESVLVIAEPRGRGVARRRGVRAARGGDRRGTAWSAARACSRVAGSRCRWKAEARRRGGAPAQLARAG